MCSLTAIFTMTGLWALAVSPFLEARAAPRAGKILRVLAGFTPYRRCFSGRAHFEGRARKAPFTAMAGPIASLRKPWLRLGIASAVELYDWLRLGNILCWGVVLSRAGLDAPFAQDPLACAGDGLTMDALCAYATMPCTATLIAGSSCHASGAFAPRAPSVRRSSVFGWIVSNREAYTAVSADPGAMDMRACWWRTVSLSSFGF